MVSHEAVRDALAAHPTAGQDQQAMVRDVCQGGAGVAVVIGRAGTGRPRITLELRRNGRPFPIAPLIALG